MTYINATSHLTRAPRLNENAHLIDIHTVSADRKSDMAYTSASTALYQGESDHAKHNDPANDAIVIDTLRQRFRPLFGHIQRINEIEIEQSIITAMAVNTPDSILTTRTCTAASEKKQDTKRCVSIHPGLPGGCPISMRRAEIRYSGQSQ